MHEIVPIHRAEPIFLPAQYKSWHCDATQRFALVRSGPNRAELCGECLRRGKFRHLQAEIQ